MKPDFRTFPTGRRLLVAGIAAAAVAAGTAGTALAAGHGDDDRPAKAPAVTADQAMGAALKAVPGTVGEADLDDGAWEIDVLTGGGAWHEVTIDASSARVTADRTGRGSDAAEAQGLKNTKVTAQQAAATALKAASGAVTSVELEHEGAQPAWEVEIAGKDGVQHELLVDGTGGTVTKNKAEHDDHGKKEDDGKHEDGKHDDGKHGDQDHDDD
ncbi:PepSY domain-containing protein [Actinomadura montaniterrae]|uniref:Peptidase M4 n=1 Tax=Actinomadura montaniterrae TaxID=1803903 RepID=A0A6L3VL74_9ACTN|nr:PepSY domain-containing protein [Actinomadura montaniterrae]KAB2370692.1 peptidase M4 [Actinomadura montaniterrae]